MLKLDPIKLVVVLSIKVISHSFIRLKAFMIFTRISLAPEAIPNVSVAIQCP